MIRRPSASVLYVPAIVLFTLVLTTDVSGAFKYLAEGMPAPAFEGREVRTDEKIKSSSYLGIEGRILIVAFWATWSERSLELLEDLAELDRDERYSRVDVIGINVESPRLAGSERDLILGVVTERDLPFPVIIDEGLTVFAEYGVVAVPSAAILDDAGTLMYGPAGYSYSIRDRIADSVETWLGMREPSEFTARPRHVPTDEASRQYNLARSLLARGLPERSLPHLENAGVADPQFAAVEVLRGDALLAMDDLAAAIEAYERAAALDESLVVAWAGLGTALALRGDNPGAETALSRAVELDPAYTPALVDLARVGLREGKVDEASSLLASAYELAPADPELNFLLGEIRESQGLIREALEAYEASLEQIFPAGWDPRESRR